jgi:hypothetical protein
MSIKSEIIDGRGTSSKAKVTSRGQLVTAPLDFSISYTQEVNATATAFNFVGPETNKRFVITDILLYANKNIGVNDASIQIYEADSDTETTVSKTILDIEMLKQTSRDITGLNLIITEGKWVNIKTDDATIFATIMGYYVPA